MCYNIFINGPLPARERRNSMTETKITAAAVYRNGCLVKRTGTVRLQPGTQQIRLTGLSASVDENSLRLSVPAGVSGSNVQIEHPTREQQQEAVRELSQKLARLQSTIQSREKLAALWEANADFSQKESLSIEEMSAYLEKLPERLETISRELTELKEQKDKLTREYNEARQKAALPFVSAELSADAAGEYPVELSYRDYQAFWNPVYEIHSGEDSDSLKLRLRAQISQNTGEDWENVALTLFSGNPSVSGTIPELNSAHIRFYVPEPVMKRKTTALFGGAMMKAARAVEDSAVAECEVMDEACEAPAMAMAMNTVIAGGGSTSKGETMTEYALNGLWDIRKGQEILCDIRTDLLPCRYHVVAVPKLSEDAYLAAEVKTSELEEMQGTPAAVYLKGAFAGNVVLEPDMTKESYDLSLGVDESVKVKRVQKKRHTSQLLLKGQKKTEYEYELTLTSRKEKEVSVSVTDQLPIPDDKTIQVEAQELSGAVREEDTGLLRWTFPLAPGETKTLTLAYSVAWPKDKQTEEIQVRI